MPFPEVEMNIFEAILARRSVRSHTSHEIDRTTVHTLLEAAVRAPTAMHQEPWGFVVIQNRQLLQRLSDLAQPFLTAAAQRPGQAHGIFVDPQPNIFYGAGTLIVIGSESTEPFVSADCWLAAENLMLAACAMKLGTCVIGSALPALNQHQAKTELGIPANFTSVAPIIVGYPAGETAPTTRREPRVLAIN